MTFSVIGAVLHGAVAVGEANSFTPNYAKAKMSASNIMMLLNRKPAIDNLSEDGLSPVNVQGPTKDNLITHAQKTVQMSQESLK